MKNLCESVVTENMCRHVRHVRYAAITNKDHPNTQSITGLVAATNHNTISVKFQQLTQNTADSYFLLFLPGNQNKTTHCKQDWNPRCPKAGLLGKVGHRVTATTLTCQPRGGQPAHPATDVLNTENPVGFMAHPDVVCLTEGVYFLLACNKLWRTMAHGRPRYLLFDCKEHTAIQKTEVDYSYKVHRSHITSAGDITGMRTEASILPSQTLQACV